MDVIKTENLNKIRFSVLYFNAIPIKKEYINFPYFFTIRPENPPPGASLISNFRLAVTGTNSLL